MVHRTALAWMTPMAPECSRGHSDWCGPGGNMALRQRHGLRLQPRLWASLWPLVAPWTLGINIDPGCGRTVDPDMVLISYSGLMSSWSQVETQASLVVWASDTNMVPGGSPDPPYRLRWRCTFHPLVTDYRGLMGRGTLQNPGAMQHLHTHTSTESLVPFV